MALKYKGRLLDHLAHDDYVPVKVATLAEDLNVPEPDRRDFAEAVAAFHREGLLVVSASGHVSLPSLADCGGEVTGVFRKSMRGFGFVEPERVVREGSVFIPESETADAITGDTVRVRVERERSRPGPSRYRGTIVEVVKRKRTNFTGTLSRRRGQWLVFPDGRELTQPVMVRDAEAKNAKEDDKVVIEITAYPEGDMLPEGVIVRVLGDAGRPDVETQAVIAAYDLPGEFPEECFEQARAAAAEFEEAVERYRREGPAALKGRLDLTEDFIITIDPPDAKDYDDAISIKPSERVPGGFDLGVHIADVATFIPRESPLDEEARDRGNSCYLPRLVIPMLPEILSNGICSLQEGVPRFCKSAFMTYDRDGNVKAEGAASVLIRSAKRLTYLEAQALIDGDIEEAKKHARTPPNYSEQLIETLRQMDRLARAIQSRRKRQGMISLELPDVELVFDEQGHVIDAVKEDDAFTHTLIEMFMVEANEVLARLFERLGVPLLRRVHPEPIPGDVDELRKAAMVAGYRVPANPTREELQGLLEATRGTPAARAVHMAVLRTLSRAEYSPALIGHFALASNAYAHFTSPIRRYADLTVHRALAEYLRLTDNSRNRPRDEAEENRLGRRLRESDACPTERELVDIGKHITIREANAESAEDELRKFLVLQLLEKKIGEAFAGVVTGVNARGVFVQIDQYLIDGFVKSEDLPGDETRDNLRPFWKLDPRSGALVDQRSGRSFNMGDSVTVKIAAVDLAKRQVDLVVVNADQRAVGKAKKISGLTLGGVGGGLGHAEGKGFKGMTGAQRRSQKSKQRDKRKGDHRRDS